MNIGRRLSLQSDAIGEHDTGGGDAPQTTRDSSPSIAELTARIEKRIAAKRNLTSLFSGGFFTTIALGARAVQHLDLPPPIGIAGIFLASTALMLLLLYLQHRPDRRDLPREVTPELAHDALLSAGYALRESSHSAATYECVPLLGALHGPILVTIEEGTVRLFGPRYSLAALDEKTRERTQAHERGH